jgi:hypothetical protein
MVSCYHRRHPAPSSNRCHTTLDPIDVTPDPDCNLMSAASEVQLVAALDCKQRHLTSPPLLFLGVPRCATAQDISTTALIATTV